MYCVSVLPISLYFMYLFFFFQAEDGMRDWSVTGVQTCALPISLPSEAALSDACDGLRDDRRTSLRLAIILLKPAMMFGDHPEDHRRRRIVPLLMVVSACADNAHMLYGDRKSVV